MAIFAANRGFQISFEIQSRSLLISSLARKGYSESEPIRYIPKSNSNIRKPQKDPALESCEAKEGILFKNGALKGKRGPHKFVAKDCKISNSRDILEQVEELPELDDANSSTLELTSTDVGSKDEPILDEVSNLYEDMIAKHDDLLSLSVRQDAEKMAIELLVAR